MPGGAAEEHRRLPGGIAAADDDGLGVLAIAGLDFGGRVIDAGPLEGLQAVDRQAPVLNPVATTTACPRTR